MSADERAVERLWKQAEEAVLACRGRRVLEPILERLMALAPDGSEASFYARRQLAEIVLAERPWNALLLLRPVSLHPSAFPSDFALCGLAHAILGNYDSCVRAYRKALQLDPENPWYEHNLGHILDVALNKPNEALPLLASAVESTAEHEMHASYAHCLHALGDYAKAKTHIDLALRLEPSHKGHRALREAIARSLRNEAKNAKDLPVEPRKPRMVAKGVGEDLGAATNGSKADRRAKKKASEQGSKENPLLDSLMQKWAQKNLATQEVDYARVLFLRYEKYRANRRVARIGEDIYAAALEYLALRHHAHRVAVADVAARHGVSAARVSARAADIQRIAQPKTD